MSKEEDEMTRGELKVCHEQIKVEVTADSMLGVISFTPPTSGGVMLSREAVWQAIFKSGIVEGVDQEKIEEIIDNHCYHHKYVIARGKEPIPGKEGGIKLHFDPEALKQLKPKINPNGTVNLKELNIVRNVTKGEILATKLTASPGEDGYTVFGKVLKAKRGKEASMPRGKNTQLLEEEGFLVAAIDGKLIYEKQQIAVDKVYRVMGDVDSHIGNIDFLGDVIVEGSVGSGFTITSGGSVEVMGIVENVTIIAKKDIVLKGGIQGNQKSKLIAGGSIIAKFIQHTKAQAGGSVITEMMIQSHVVAEESVYVEGGKGTIVGGSISARHCIKGQSMGSSLGVITHLMIGVSPDAYQRYKEISSELRESRSKLNKIEQDRKFLINKEKAGTLDQHKQETLWALYHTKQQLEERIHELKESYESMGRQLNKEQEGKIKFSEALYPGVKVVYGNLAYYVDHVYHKGTIKRIGDEIIIE